MSFFPENYNIFCFLFSVPAPILLCGYIFHVSYHDVPGVPIDRAQVAGVLRLPGGCWSSPSDGLPSMLGPHYGGYCSDGNERAQLWPLSLSDWECLL